MNYWTEKSVEFAGQRNYLDELFKVYPLIPNLRRELSQEQVEAVRLVYDARNNLALVETLLDTELFPLKDSYVPFLRHDREALKRNPQIAIIDGVIYIKNHSKMHKYLHRHPKDNIMSALVLCEFLYSL